MACLANVFLVTNLSSTPTVSTHMTIIFIDAWCTLLQLTIIICNTIFPSSLWHVRDYCMHNIYTMSCIYVISIILISFKLYTTEESESLNCMELTHFTHCQMSLNNCDYYIIIASMQLQILINTME